MKFVTRHQALAAAALSGVILLFAASVGAQEGRQNRDDSDPVKLRTPFPFRPFGGMTAIDPPSADGKSSETQPNTDQPVGTGTQPKRSFLSGERTPNGTLFRYSDGSTLELRPEYDTETLRDGTKIEKLPTGTTIARWPNGAGVIRNPDGTGAEFKPDSREPSRSGDLSKINGTIELLSGGVIRQTLKMTALSLTNIPMARSDRGAISLSPTRRQPISPSEKIFLRCL